MARTEGAPTGAPRGGARRGAKPKRALRPELLALGGGALVALAAWAVLVWLAIGFGHDARGGDSGRWVLLAVASLAAVGCLFLCLWLCTTLLRRIGILENDRRPTPPHRH
jgi:hypothetical protein